MALWLVICPPVPPSVPPSENICEPSVKDCWLVYIITWKLTGAVTTGEGSVIVPLIAFETAAAVMLSVVVLPPVITTFADYGNDV